MEVILKPHHRQVLLGISQTESHSHKEPAEKLATELCVCQKFEAMGLAHGREINLNHRICGVGRDPQGLSSPNPSPAEDTPRVTPSA